MRISAIFLLALCLSVQAAQGPSMVRQFPASGPLNFDLQDHLDHPFYWWPRTLLNYPVRFDQAKVRRTDLRLSGPGGTTPFQLSEVKEGGGYLQSAIVSFFADLPAGAGRRFVLSMGGAAPPTTAPQVKESREGQSIILDTGAMRVRLPDSRTVSGEAPGPILQAARDATWLGKSRIVSPKRPVEAITATRVESGPLFIAYRITYRFQGGARYNATVRAIAGYDFVQLFEEMEGITPDEGIHVRMDWTGYQPTHRQAPNHPYHKENPAPGYGRYNWETIDQGNVSTQHGVSAGIGADGELPFRLGPYQPWGAYVILTSANFWDERSNHAVGIFIDRVGQWQDHDYAIWASSNTLQVRYFYNNGLLSWRSPLSTGTRSTGLAVYDHRKDIQSMEALDKLASAPMKYRDGLTYRAKLSPMSHTMFLQNRHGTIDLDMVKDWVLDYPANAKRPPVLFSDGDIKSAAQLEQRIFSAELTRDLPTQGTRQNAGFAPVPSRSVYGWFIDGYNRFFPQLNERQRERLTAMYLMMAYTHGEEEYMPLRTMISGHPNFLSDVKSAPPLFAFLFPDHPMAGEWADQFEKFLELNTRYHTRPEVKSWDSRGGRWTENLGTYVWAFLRPAMHAEFALRQSVDGKNRLAMPGIAHIGDWLVNALSAPFNGEDPAFYVGPDGKIPRHYWGMVTAETGPRRVHPPQGAHSSRRMPPKSMWLLGRSLLNYDPLTAEYMMWAAKPGDDDAEHAKDLVDAWSIMYRGPDNRGTNPHLKSSKFTGYGINLRAAVDTPNEVSVHLQQIDEGPNYRWGIAGEGGSGVIYYYAAGKSYSHNGREDVGDRPAHDTDFATNFGVWKDGRFKSIGRNVLDRPLYDLDGLQFAEVVSRPGRDSYSWPEYQGRSVMMAGADYFVVYDDVFNDAVANRFSWMTHGGETLPKIHMVKGGMRDRQSRPVKIQTDEIHGVWHDGLGDAMAVVTHRDGLRDDLKVTSRPWGCTVASATSTDQVFRDPDGIDYESSGIAFRGKSGIIRQRGAGGGFQMAVFQGTRIATGGVELNVSGKDVGISAHFQQPGELAGQYVGTEGGTLTLACAACTPESAFYIDGVRQTVRAATGGMAVTLTPGRHRWQLTKGLPMPDAPSVSRTENSAGKTNVVWNTVPGAEKYRVEISGDNAKTWRPAGETAATALTVGSLENGKKYHVRLIAANSRFASDPGLEYPVYASADAPPSPDGLRVALTAKSATLTWGEVLGASGYRLYRRAQGSQDFRLVHSGLSRQFADAPEGLRMPFDVPGKVAAELRGKPGYSVWEYAIAAVNGNGEGPKSTVVTTDPASWVNWDPRPGEPFRRRYSYNTTNYLRLGVEEDYSRYYPK